MADITVTFRDGTTHTYQGAPDGATQVQVLQRVLKDHPDRADNITGIEGAQPSSLGERLKAFATQGQVGEHGVLSSDLPQLIYGVVDSLTLGQVADKLPEAKTRSEKDSREAGRELPLAAGPKAVGGQSMLRPPNFAGGSWVTGAQARAAQLARAAKTAGGAAVPAQTSAQQIMGSPIFKMIAKAAGFGSAAEMVHQLYGYVTGK